MMASIYDRKENTYKVPRAKTAKRASLARRFICSFTITGIGKTRTITSIRVFHPDWAYQNILRLMLEGTVNTYGDRGETR